MVRGKRPFDASGPGATGRSPAGERCGRAQPREPCGALTSTYVVQRNRPPACYVTLWDFLETLDLHSQSMREAYQYARVGTTRNISEMNEGPPQVVLAFNALTTRIGWKTGRMAMRCAAWGQ